MLFVANVSRVWASPLFAKTVGASYGWAMEHPSVARWFFRVVMDADVDRVYRAMNAIGEYPTVQLFSTFPVAVAWRSSDYR